MIKLFIFDMGGVLVQNFNILHEAAEILELSFKDLLDYVREDLIPIQEGTLSAEDFWKRFSSRSGKQVKRELWAELFNPTVDKNMESYIIKINKSYRVVCGTNTLDSHYEFHKSRGDYKVFDTVYASHLMGIAKPKKEFYQWILDKESVLPEETVFVDDFPENIETARAMGIHSFLFKDEGLFKKELHDKGIFTHTRFFI